MLLPTGLPAPQALDTPLSVGDCGRWALLPAHRRSAVLHPDLCSGPEEQEHGLWGRRQAHAQEPVGLKVHGRTYGVLGRARRMR